MLKTRIVTAVVLLGGFLGALFLLPPLGWLCVMALVASLAAWEWGGLMRLAASVRIAFGLAMLCVCAGMAWAWPLALGLGGGTAETAWVLGRWVYSLAAAFWLLLIPLWMKSRWTLANRVVGCLTGVVVILPAWLALVQLRQLGPVPLLAIMAIVWLADIGAYFFGRAFGRRKLAPTISPGKTWEGAFGGALVVVAYGLLVAPHVPGIPAGNGVLLFLFLVCLTAISIVGDLFESLLKRQVALKDSSNILPGHGGVLDRIDSLTSTLPLVALLWFGINS